jgi:zearalenone synthase (highly reducing iterative type I polyketide synthase)
MACDVSDAVSLGKALSECRQQLGPIRGVIQCAMVLRDTLFSKMSYKDWVESTRPKVQGTRNLDQALPDVDLFCHPQQLCRDIRKPLAE